MIANAQRLHRFAHEAMNTTFEVVIAAEDALYPQQASAAIFRQIDYLETLLSRFDPGSDISQVNRLRPGQSVPVSLEAFECLQLAATVFAETGGAFDVTIGPLMNCVRAAKGEWSKVNEADRAAARARMGMPRVVLNSKDFSVSVTGEVEVDLGALGKGYALDKATEILPDWGIENALLCCGPSTALAIGSGGEPAGCPAGSKGWAVGVGGDWGETAGMEAVLLSGSAVSGSGTEGQGQHILDPRMAAPTDHHRAAWAIAPTAALSDALSTAFMIMSTTEVKAYCRAHPEVTALVVERRRGVLKMFKDKVVATPGFAACKVQGRVMDIAPVVR